jgi:hypothetical protein
MFFDFDLVDLHSIRIVSDGKRCSIYPIEMSTWSLDSCSASLVAYLHDEIFSSWVIVLPWRHTVGMASMGFKNPLPG